MEHARLWEKGSRQIQLEEEENMKSKNLGWISLMTLLAALAISGRLSAQEQQRAAHHL
jgi:hypothetical protein